MAVFTDEGKTYHVRVGKGDIGRYVLLPGDPFRTDLIASYFDDAKLVAHNREHKTWTGTLNGVPVSVVSTGMGCPSTAICLEELIACGADTFIRVGTAGRVCDRAFDPTLDGVINTAAVRDEGTTKHYIPIEYPAVADRHVAAAAMSSAPRWSPLRSLSSLPSAAAAPPPSWRIPRCRRASRSPSVRCASSSSRIRLPRSNSTMQRLPVPKTVRGVLPFRIKYD